MSDERYYTVRATFDPTFFADLSLPWTPTANAGQDPSDMRRRSLTTARVGRFRPDVLGRKAKSTSSLVQVWTDGPVMAGDRYYVLGSDDASESNPTSVQRGDAAALTTSPLDAPILELGPTDHLAIDTQNGLTTCYIRVVDLEEKQAAQWLTAKAKPLCCNNTPTQDRRTIGGEDFPAVLTVLMHDVTIVLTVPGDPGDVLSVPAFSLPADAHRILKIINSGIEPLTIDAADGAGFNGTAIVSLVLPVGEAIELQPFELGLWCAVPA